MGAFRDAEEALVEFGRAKRALLEEVGLRKPTDARLKDAASRFLAAVIECRRIRGLEPE